MSNCIQYRRKGEREAITLAKLDDEICDALGVSPDPDKFYLGWFDYIGLLQSCGKTFTEVRETVSKYDPESFTTKQYLRIVDYLEENFDPNSWVEVGRR